MDRLKTVPPPRLTERRQTYRRRATVPALLEGIEQAIAINLSAGGLKIQCGSVLRVERELLIGLRGKGLAGGMPPRLVTAKTRVVWCRRARGRFGYEAGVAFSGFMGTDLESVLEYFKVELGVELPDMGRQKREGIRIARRFKVTYSVSGRPASGFVRNLGVGGVQILSKSEVPLDADVDLTLDLGNTGERITLSGKTRYCRRAEAELHQIGVAFQNLSETDRGILRTFIAAELHSDFVEG